MRQQIEVLLSSGDVDTWNRVYDAVVEAGALHILEEADDESQLERVKTLKIMSEIDNGPDLPPGTLTRVYLLRAIYAPGMWMKVVYTDQMRVQ